MKKIQNATAVITNQFWMVQSNQFKQIIIIEMKIRGQF
jgi:hypothetical protein